MPCTNRSVGRNPYCSDDAETNFSAIESDLSDVQTEVNKITETATLGLGETYNSLAYRVAEIERHLHSGARWYEKATTPSGETHVADRIGVGAGAFQIDAGNDDWGSWVQILGSSDTPAEVGKAYFDPHQFIVEDGHMSSLNVF